MAHPTISRHCHHAKQAWPSKRPLDELGYPDQADSLKGPKFTASRALNHGAPPGGRTDFSNINFLHARIAP
eukprot:6114575-Pyramimonas_sp.AAC.1